MDRKQALQTILTELNLSTIGERKAALRQLDRVLCSYREERASKVADFAQWATEVKVCSGRLAELLSSIPYQPYFGQFFENTLFRGGQLPPFIDRLQTLAEVMIEEKVARGRPKKHRPGMRSLIFRLDKMYTAATGNPGTVWRRNDGSKRKQGAPDGPFFRVVKAAQTLAGDQQSDEANFKEIEAYKEMRELLVKALAGDQQSDEANFKEIEAIKEIRETLFRS